MRIGVLLRPRMPPRLSEPVQQCRSLTLRLDLVGRELRLELVRGRAGGGSDEERHLHARPVLVIGRQERGPTSKTLHGQALTRLSQIGAKIGRFSGLFGLSCCDAFYFSFHGSE